MSNNLLNAYDEERPRKNKTYLEISRLFSSVLKSHTREDAESLFIVGTPDTTPEWDEISVPRPWLFSRILVISLLAYLGFYIGLFRFGNLNFLPGLIIIGAFIVPVSLLVFFWEMNIVKNISVYNLIIYFLIGGLAALLYTVLLYGLIDGNDYPLLIGFIEETAKVLALAAFAAKKRFKYILNGMLIGAAIGTGFAAFETSGYVMTAALQYGLKTMLQTIFWRAIMAPGGHVAWGALTGAAFVWVKGDHPVKIRTFFKLRFLGMYALVILLHSLWDTEIPQAFLFGIPLLPIALILISWIFLFIMMKIGVKQVVRNSDEQFGTVSDHPQ